MKYQIYQDSKNEWRWRLRASNGEPIANGGEGYKNKADCEHGISLVKSSANAPVEEVEN